MKIVHLITHYYPHVYGAENFALHLAEHQARYHDVHVVTGLWDPSWKISEIVNGVTVHRVGVNKTRYIQTLIAWIPILAKALQLNKEQKIDLLHAHIYPSLIAGAFFKKFTRAKVIVTIQGGDLGDYPEVFGPKPVANIFKVLIGWCLRQVDLVHCVSSHLVTEVIKLGVEKSKVKLVSNGVDTAKFRPANRNVDSRHPEPTNIALSYQTDTPTSSQTDTLTSSRTGRSSVRMSSRTCRSSVRMSSRTGRRQDPGSPKPIRFISTSRLEDKNNLPSLVKLITALHKKHENITLDIYGAGSQHQALKNLIKDLNSSKYIKLKGYIENTKLAQTLPKYNYFIRLSKQEGFGISFIEAMACGVIPIATQIGGIKDIIKDKENGYFIDLNEDLVKQLESIITKNTAKLAQSARKETVEKFSWDNVLRQMDKLILRTWPGS
jgi:glycosyltransferase involved in cell wall biosynthesis